MSYASKRRIPAAATIDIEDDGEIANWAQLLGVSEEEIVRAVDAVGPFAAAVQDYLTREE
jgi:Protein of unknown function (DUF3606)